MSTDTAIRSAFIGIGSGGLMGLIERIVCPYKYKGSQKIRKLFLKFIRLFVIVSSCSLFII